VTDSGALRIGDVVYVYCAPNSLPLGMPAAGGCKCFHRGITIDFEALREIGSRFLIEDAWRFVPKTPCGGDCFSRGAFVAGFVWRVINQPLASDDAEENRGLDRRRLRKALAR
jgi:hypothetical protein